MINATLYAGAGHPNVVAWFATALWSINERLAQRDGADLDQLGGEWVNDVLSALSRRVHVQQKTSYDGPLDDGAAPDSFYESSDGMNEDQEWRAV